MNELPKISPEDYITCAYCSGNGKDPFAVMSPLSSCGVCGGSGTTFLPAPRTKCVFCRATGIQQSLRLTCTGCGGKGWHTVRSDAGQCPVCAGAGSGPENPKLPCAKCGGAGIV
jgi:hypothetical protein